MSEPSVRIEQVYLTLTITNTLAASFIWGVNTLFLLDAGLTNTEAFAANAFFTLGMVLFEVPTGVVADTRGRRFSFLLGTGTLLASTLLYLLMWQLRAPFWGWAVSSVLIGLGFTFFSGAMEAWLVDALQSSGFTGNLETVFARAQVAGGVAMLAGSLLGGVVAQFSNLGVPYLLRAALLGGSALIAWRWMRDLGFVPIETRPAPSRPRRAGRRDRGRAAAPSGALADAAAPFTAGTGIYVFYALQPHLPAVPRPQRVQHRHLAAALVAGAQIVGGLVAPKVRGWFGRRTDALLLGGMVAVILLAGIGLTTNFWLALALVAGWAMTSAIVTPLRQSFINGEIPSAQRATVLSFDSLMGSSGGVVVQPALGRVADVAGYPASYLGAAAIQVLAIPFVLLARRERAASDPIEAADHTA